MLNNSSLLQNIINIEDQTEDFLEKRLLENEKDIQKLENNNNEESSSLRSINDLQNKNERRFSQASNLTQSDIKSIEQNNQHKESIVNISSQQIDTFSSSSQKNINYNINTNISSKNKNNNKNNNKNERLSPIKVNIKCRNKIKKYPKKINYENNSLSSSFYFNQNNYPDINYNYINYLKFNEYVDFLYPDLLRNKSSQKKNKTKNTSFDSANSNIDFNISQILQRSVETQRKKNAKIEQLKKIKEDNEIKDCSHKPKISKKSQELASHVKDDFFTRQKKLIIEQNKREDLMKKRYRKFELYKFHLENDKGNANSCLNIRPYRKNSNEIEDYNKLVYNMNKQKIQKQKNKNKSQVNLLDRKNLNLTCFKNNKYEKRKKELTKACLYPNSDIKKKKDKSLTRKESIENYYYKNSADKNSNKKNNNNSIRKDKSVTRKESIENYYYKNSADKNNNKKNTNSNSIRKDKNVKRKESDEKYYFKNSKGKYNNNNNVNNSIRKYKNVKRKESIENSEDKNNISDNDSVEEDKSVKRKENIEKYYYKNSEDSYNNSNSDNNNIVLKENKKKKMQKIIIIKRIHNPNKKSNF